MIAIVVVSHSAKVAEGVKELAEQMSQNRVKILAAGGVDEHTIGTNAERIYTALTEAMNDNGVLVLLDLGSAAMSAQFAVEMLPAEQQGRVRLSQGPLVEGAIIAAIEASGGNDLDTVNAAAEAAAQLPKLP